MGISKTQNRHGNLKIYVSKRWPDGSRFRRVMPNYPVARKTLARIEESIAMGTWEGLKTGLSSKAELVNPTIRQFAQVYLDTYCNIQNRRPEFKKWALGQINEILGEVKVKDIRRAHGYKFIEKRSKDVEAATVNRGLAVLKNLLTFAVDKEIIPYNPLFGFSSLPEPVKELRVMTLEEERWLVKCVAEVDLVVGAFVAILGETALRLSEGLRLKWYDLDLKERILTVSSESKSGKVRYVPLTDFALEWLQAIPRTVGVDWVFLRTRTQPWRSPRPVFFEGRKKADLEWVGFHGLRHFRASQWVRCGVDIRTVQNLLGHATIATTQRYAHFAPSHARSEVERVGALERSTIERDDSGTT